MIYITGDTHGDFTRLNPIIFPEQENMTKEDYVIILGDFGGIWTAPDIIIQNNVIINGKDKQQENKILDELNNKPFTILFIDGNHENFHRLNTEYPVKMWKGGKVHEIRKHVLHLMRGQVFEIEGLKFFTFGGAKSHDISDGILNPSMRNFDSEFYRLKTEHKQFRIEGFSWWKEEMPNDSEKAEALSNLAKHGNKVDIILTHDAPTSTMKLLNSHYESDWFTNFLEEIRVNTEYRYWFNGHYHVNKQINSQDMIIYEQILRVV